MARYIIQSEFVDTIPSKEIMDVVNPEIEKTHVYRNIYTYKTKPLGKNKYEQDSCLNRYDLNQTILDKIVETNIRSKLWTIDPEFMTLDMAIKLANMGEGKFLSDRYKKMWELEVLRYIAGERDFFTPTDYYSHDRLISESVDAKCDLEGYIYEFKVNHDGYIEFDKNEYIKEEERALNQEEERLDGKSMYCLDIMKDIVQAKNNISLVRNKR